MVKIILGLPKIPKPDDAADALALAICHAHCGGSKIQQFYNGKKKNSFDKGDRLCFITSRASS